MLPYQSTKSCLAVLLASLLLAAGGATAASLTGTAGSGHATYSDDEVVNAANDFFKNGAEDLSKVLRKVLKEKGQPVAVIRGEEGGGAIGVGLRYGHGELLYKGSAGRKIYWQGPSIGFDVGANAVKVFALVYDLPTTEQLFQRFPGVEGSLYFVGGFGVNYVQSDHIVIAPVRFGVGWRQGIAVSYMHFSPTKRINPF
jgi:hypothetical protein